MEIKIYKSPWKSVKLMGLCSIFVALGIWGIATDSMPAWVAWMNISFFGLAYPVGFYHLLDRRPQIIINEHGVFDRTFHKDFINWEIIQDAYAVEINSVKFICLVITDDFKPSRHKKGSFYKSMTYLNEAMGFQELNLNLSALNVDELRLTALILALRRAPKSERAQLLATSLR